MAELAVELGQAPAPALEWWSDPPPATSEGILNGSCWTRPPSAPRAIRARCVGSGLQVDLHIQVDPEMSVLDGHEVARNVRRRLVAEGPDITDVIVHLKPDLSQDTGAQTRPRPEA